jgi:hypothetical protein
MADPQEVQVEVTAKTKVIDSKTYLLSVASKKVSYAVGMFIVAKATNLVTAPAAYEAFQHVAELLKPLGIGLTVDPVVFVQAFPVAMFAGLVALHDYIKVKTGLTWL